MDWTKAKTILIVALLVTNIFLIVSYSIVQAENDPTEETIQMETIALLESKDIYIKDDLPSVHEKMSVLRVEYDRLEPQDIKKKIWEQVPLDENRRSREDIIKMTEGFLKSCKIWYPNVELDRVEQKGNTTFVYYRNVYQGIRVEDSYIICTVEGGQVIEMDRSWVKPVEYGRTKKATMSASAALLNLMSEKHEYGSILVEDMEMVYRLESSDYETKTTIADTAFPAWKITYNNGKIKYVFAYND